MLNFVRLFTASSTSLIVIQSYGFFRYPPNFLAYFLHKYVLKMLIELLFCCVNISDEHFIYLLVSYFVIIDSVGGVPVTLNDVIKIVS